MRSVSQIVATRGVSSSIVGVIIPVEVVDEAIVVVVDAVVAVRLALVALDVRLEVGVI